MSLRGSGGGSEDASSANLLLRWLQETVAPSEPAPEDNHGNTTFLFWFVASLTATVVLCYGYYLYRRDLAPHETPHHPEGTMVMIDLNPEQRKAVLDIIFSEASTVRRLNTGVL